MSLEQLYDLEVSAFASYELTKANCCRLNGDKSLAFKVEKSPVCSIEIS